MFDNMGDAMLYLLITGAVILVVAGVSLYSQRRKGTGSFAAYGPNSTKAQRELIDRARAIFEAGVALLQQGDEISARWRWEEAARLGNVQAVTGLGMIKFDGDDVEGARADWKRAADAGDVPAEIFLQLTDEHWTATTYTYEQAATAYLDVVCGRGANAFIRFRDIAEGLEHQAYADELHARVVARQAAEANSFWPGQMNRRSV